MENRVGKRIYALRKGSGLSQGQLAIRSGVNQTYISHIEKGRRQGTPEVLARIAAALRVDLGLLLTTNEEDYSKLVFKLKSLSKRSLREADNFLDFLLAKEIRRSKDDTEFGEEYNLIFQKIHSTPRNDKRVA